MLTETHTYTQTTCSLLQRHTFTCECLICRMINVDVCVTTEVNKRALREGWRWRASPLAASKRQKALSQRGLSVRPNNRLVNFYLNVTFRLYTSLQDFSGKMFGKLFLPIVTLCLLLCLRNGAKQFMGCLQIWPEALQIILAKEKHTGQEINYFSWPS